MIKRIVYTRHDGGVTVCCPSERAVAWLGCGGFWNHHPRGFADIQIERMISRGVGPYAAQRYAKAMTVGGCTTAEALEIIRDRDCAHLGTAIELLDVDELPSDRWFRNAWRRSHNGGPINTDLKLARPIQFRHIRTAVNDENKKRAADLERFDQAIEVDFGTIRHSIMKARDEAELRHVWPSELIAF